jgi:hypothetical protein
MPAVASTIFKIRAHSDFIAPPDASPDLLSFRKGQPFYALSADYEKGIYFVSTQFAVPFARTAVSGLVPMEYFEKVDLMSRDPPMQKRKVSQPNIVQKQIVPTRAAPVAEKPQVDNTLPSVPVRKQSLSNNPEWKDTISDLITTIDVLSLSKDEMFCIKVGRGKMAHIISRSIPEFISLAAAAAETFPKINTENYPLAFESSESKVKAMEAYLRRLILEMIPGANHVSPSLQLARQLFFNPKDAQEFLSGQTIVRRDSGASTEQEKEQNIFSSSRRPSTNVVSVTATSFVKSPKQKSAKNPFSSFTKMVFGH